MTSQFEVGDKVDLTYSNHVEGTVVAVFTNRAGDDLPQSGDMIPFEPGQRLCA
jgi:hypothetical protein